MSRAVLHWNDALPAVAPGAEGPLRSATFNSVHEALEQAVAEDGLEPLRIANEAGDQIFCSKQQIADYAAAKAEGEKKVADKVAAAEEAHRKALAALVPSA